MEGVRELHTAFSFENECICIHAQSGSFKGVNAPHPPSAPPIHPDRTNHLVGKPKARLRNERVRRCTCITMRSVD